MKLTKKTLKKLIKEELDSLNESLAIRTYVENAFGGKRNLRKWAGLYGAGGDNRVQAIEMAKVVLGEDNWELALIHAAGGRYMTDKQKEIERAAGHTQYAREREKMFSRASLGKRIGQKNLDKLASMGQRQYVYDPNISDEERERRKAMINQRDSMLDAFKVPRNIFDKPFLSRKQLGSALEYDNQMGTTILEEMGADFIFEVVENARVQRMTDLDFGSIDVTGGYNAGAGNFGELSSVYLTVYPQVKEDPVTNEPLEYELDKQFTIVVEDTEDYYDANVDSEEEMQERLQIQLTQAYGR